MTDDPKKHVCPHDVQWCGDTGSLCRMCREDRADKRAQILADAVGDAVAHRNIAEALEEPVDETGWPALTTDAEPKSLPRRRPHVPPVDPLFRDDALTQAPARWVDVLVDGPPGDDLGFGAPHLVDLEDQDHNQIQGDWHQESADLWRLRIPVAGCRWIRCGDRLPPERKQVPAIWVGGFYRWAYRVGKRWSHGEASVKVDDLWLEGVPAPPAPKEADDA